MFKTLNRRFLHKIRNDTWIISNDEAPPTQIMKHNLDISVLPSPAATTNEVTELVQQDKITETEPSVDQLSPVTINNYILPATK